MSSKPNAARKRRIKRQLAARDGATCFYCGHPFGTLVEATIDHLVPKSKLPGWVQANLVLACRPCNKAKADRLPQEFLRPCGFAPGLVPLGPPNAPTPDRRRVRHTAARLSGVLSAICPAGLTAVLSARWAGRLSAGTARTVPGPVRHVSAT